MRLLLVEDDPMIGKSVQQGLRQDGFSVDWVQDGTAADLALANEVYDLLLLDLGLPKKNGSQILGGLRAQGNPIPVLILTARDAIADRVKALDGGADDFLMKPFDLSVGASTSEALRDWSCESPVAIDPVLLRPPEAKKKARMEGNPVRAWGFTCSSKGGRTNKQQRRSSAYIPGRSVGWRTYRSIYFL